MKWALERVIEFMFAIMLLIGAGTVGYEIKNWEMMKTAMRIYWYDWFIISLFAIVMITGVVVLFF